MDDAPTNVFMEELSTFSHSAPIISPAVPTIPSAPASYAGFALPTPTPIPGLFSLPSSSLPSASAGPFSALSASLPLQKAPLQPPLGDLNPTSAAPTNTTEKFTPVTTPAWNPVTRILKPAAVEPPLPPTTLTEADVVLGGTRAKRRQAVTKKAVALPKKVAPPSGKATAKKAVAPPLSSSSSEPSTPPPPPKPARPTPTARALTTNQPSLEESQDSLGRRSGRKRGVPMRELVPLVSRSNKENIPPWCGDLSLGMRGRQMGDKWDLLVRSYERLEADMNQAGTSLQRLPVSSLRPKELVLWLVDRNFDVEPEIKNIDTYGSTWRDWWNGIQHPLATSHGQLALARHRVFA
ncbi:hypothetical protein BDZ89DRAFT_1152311 [Hymenopellis radicata]|nr:hypothetical protein BDZ89DRAFT_1152311 [Hymenopellis radicata]